MDRELRELHAQMRETETRMKQGGQSPPHYADLQKLSGGGATSMYQTKEFRPLGEVRSKGCEVASRIGNAYTKEGLR
jgi:hypothetical protein